MDESAASAPTLSVLLASRDGFEGVRTTLGYLQRQTVAAQLEIVLVFPVSKCSLPADDTLPGFHSRHVVPIDRIDMTGAALAAGVRRATAPLVAYAEEHAFPEPTWAEALIAAHRQPWAAVGATLDNANPTTSTSWAHLYTDFGPAVWPVPSSEVAILPWHSTSYKRALLLAYGDRLPLLLEIEGLLHQDLRAKGHRLYLESAARLRHTNPSTVEGHIKSEFFGGRMFGAARADAAQWSMPHRMLRSLAWPLAPAVRLRRTLRHVRRRTRTGERLLPRILPALLLGLTVHALGEATGYLFGDGGAMQRRVDIELNRNRYISADDRQHLAAHHAAAATRRSG